MNSIPKNFGFKTIPVEDKSRTIDHNTTQYNFDTHMRNAKKDFAEYAREAENDKI